MLQDELEDIIHTICSFQAESQTIEVKCAHEGCPKKLFDTISAFANQDSGGVIVFGLDEREDFAIKGVYNVQDLQKHVSEQCEQMEPIIRPLFTMIKIDGKDIVSVEIPGIEVFQRPCFYKGVGRIKGSYIRVGDFDKGMSEYEIYSYEAYRKHLLDDVRTHDRVNDVDINIAALLKYIEGVKEEKPNLMRLDIEHILQLLNIKNQGMYSLYAIMMFSYYPQIFYPQYCILATVVPGERRGSVTKEGIRFLDNRRIEGTLSEMLASALSFVSKNMRKQTVISDKTGKREDRTEYPIIAIREIIINALLHRDYSMYTQNTPIELVMYEDRIEITNPGGLYGRMSVDELGKKQPEARNPNMIRAMEAIQECENRYSGIPIIRHEMEKYHLPQPEFIDKKDSFTVILRNQKEIKPMAPHRTMEQEKILAFCENAKSKQELCEFLGIKTFSYIYHRYLEELILQDALCLELPRRPNSPHQRYYTKK